MNLIIQNKKVILTCFRVLYFFITLFILSGYFAIGQSIYFPQLYELGELFGKVALVLFSITITPGILRRFGISWKVSTVIMLFRRQFGVLTFLFGFTHFSYLRLFPWILNIFPFSWSLSLHEWLGVFAITLMSFLFLTSNSWSVQNLQKWWSRIHTLVYVIAWIIAFHVAILKIDIYGTIIITFAIMETVSLLYFYFFRNKNLYGSK